MKKDKTFRNPAMQYEGNTTNTILERRASVKEMKRIIKIGGSTGSVSGDGAITIDLTTNKFTNNPTLQLYVWFGFQENNGKAIAIAENEYEAKEMIRERNKIDEDHWGVLATYPLTKKIVFLDYKS